MTSEVSISGVQYFAPTLGAPSSFDARQACVAHDASLLGMALASLEIVGGNAEEVIIIISIICIIRTIMIIIIIIIIIISSSSSSSKVAKQTDSRQSTLLHLCALGAGRCPGARGEATELESI